jgi:DNA-directed RNA polymerase I, II, and III subunit RPABC5
VKQNLHTGKKIEKKGAYKRKEKRKKGTVVQHTFVPRCDPLLAGMIPVRCFECNKVLGSLYRRYDRLIRTMSVGEALDRLGLTRLCCRKNMQTSVNMIERILDYDCVNTLRLPDDTSHEFIAVYREPYAHRKWQQQQGASAPQPRHLVHMDPSLSAEHTGNQSTVIDHEDEFGDPYGKQQQWLSSTNNAATPGRATAGNPCCEDPAAQQHPYAAAMTPSVDAGGALPSHRCSNVNCPLRRGHDVHPSIKRRRIVAR